MEIRQIIGLLEKLVKLKDEATRVMLRRGFFLNPSHFFSQLYLLFSYPVYLDYFASVYEETLSCLSWKKFGIRCKDQDTLI